MPNRKPRKPKAKKAQGATAQPLMPKQSAQVINHDQRTTAPVAQQLTRKTPAPRIVNTREGCVITHREYIADVVRTTNDFSLDSYSINPGLAGSFPWLAQVASRFESYTFERLDFIYEPSVPTSQPGTIMMAIDFDSADAAPANKTTMLAMQGAMRSAPWQGMRISASALDRKKMVTERYTRSGTVPTGSDVKTLDVGNLFLASIGTGGPTVTLGDLSVHYTVRLRTPQIQTAPGLSLARRAIQTGRITLTPAGGITANVANIIGEGPTPLLLAGNNANTRTMFLHPSIRRFLLAYSAIVSGGTFTSTVNSIINNPSFGSGNYWGAVTENTTRLARFGRVSNMPHVPVDAGGSYIAESIAATEPDPEFIAGGLKRGQSTSAWPLLLRSLGSMSNATSMTMSYTLIPLESEPWPFVGTASWVTEASSTADANFKWPTDIVVQPARAYEDGVNFVQFGKPLEGLEPLQPPKRR